MMKKIVTILAAAMLTLGGAANAMAYWSAGDLIQVVYNQGGTTEIATDLGAVGSFANQSVSVDLKSLNGGNPFADYANLYVTYFAVQPATSGNNGVAWVNGLDGTASVTGNRQFNTFVSNNTLLMQNYGNYGSAGTGQVVASQADANSYFNLMDKGGLQYGPFGTYITAATGETSLSALAGGGSATSTLWQMLNQGGSSVVTTGQLAMNFTTTIGANGVLNASSGTPTPIPPSFLLMGSGLLGMVGIRRKFTA